MPTRMQGIHAEVAQAAVALGMVPVSRLGTAGAQQVAATTGAQPLASVFNLPPATSRPPNEMNAQLPTSEHGLACERRDLSWWLGSTDGVQILVRVVPRAHCCHVSATESTKLTEDHMLIRPLLLLVYACRRWATSG